MGHPRTLDILVDPVCNKGNVKPISGIPGELRPQAGHFVRVYIVRDPITDDINLPGVVS